MPDQMQWLYPWMHVFGRLFFSLLFISSGIAHLKRLGPMSEYAASKGIPAPKLAVAFTGIVILSGGLLVLIGWTRFIGVGLLFLFLIPAAFLIHPYWKETDPANRELEKAHFYKNIALAGAALLIAYYGGGYWPLSFGG